MKYKQGEVEHLRPKSKYPGLRCEWTNLFWACQNCNGTKSDRYPDTIIDCCSEEPESLIIQRVHKGKIIIKAKKFKSPQKQKAATDTARLIHECFYGRPPTAPTDKFMVLRKSEKCGALQNEVKKEIIKLCNLLCDYRTRKTKGKDCSVQFNEICRMLNRNHEFACFTRSFVRERLDMFPEFREKVAVTGREACGDSVV